MQQRLYFFSSAAAVLDGMARGAFKCEHDEAIAVRPRPPQRQEQTHSSSLCTLLPPRSALPFEAVDSK